MKSYIILLIPLLILVACGAPIEGNDPHTETAPDLIGDWYMPLYNSNYQYEYNYRTDTNTFEFEKQNIEVFIRNYNLDEYLYGFANSDESILLTNVKSPVDKSGTYYSGYSNQDTTILVDTLVLFIPQFPQKGMQWKLWNDHTMKVLAVDTLLYLDLAENVLPDNQDMHKVVVYSETWGDWEIVHYYKRRVGLVAQQRNFNGHLISWGELKSR